MPRSTSFTCGICEYPTEYRDEKIWLNHLSTVVHPICLRWIHKENAALQNILDDYLPERSVYRDLAQQAAVKIIKQKIGDASILNYKRENGDALSNLIQSPAVETAIKAQKAFAEGDFTFPSNSVIPVYF